ncbi:MAG TPA: hypothetical protein ENF17_01485 [Candidatus Aminicenantes bacterium]|nr:hypothetical protein [Candidatus Aminicenantes bacterium]
MSKKKKKGITRREFMADAAKGALVMGCLTIAGAEEAWAQAIKQQVNQQIKRVPTKPTVMKPLLTVENLNKFYQENWSKPEFEKYIQEAKSNLESFINQHFILTAKQKEFFKSRIAKSKMPEINNFLNTIDTRTKTFRKLKMAGGSPGMITPIGDSSGKECSEGQSWKCVKVDLGTVSFEYCWCS